MNFNFSQAHKRPYTNMLDVLDSKFVNPGDTDPPDGYENWCNERIYPKRSGHINVAWKVGLLSFLFQQMFGYLCQL